MNYSQKKQRLQKLIETMVRQELREMSEAPGASSSGLESEINAVQTVLDLLQKPQITNKLKAISSVSKKVELINKFIQMVGVPSTGKADIIKNIGVVAKTKPVNKMKS